jgi:hypothetical protein
MANVDKLRAIAATNTKNAPDAIAAAIDKSLKSLTRVLASAGVELDSVGKISAIELSKKLKAAGYSPEKRLETKVVLQRAQLLAD